MNTDQEEFPAHATTVGSIIQRQDALPQTALVDAVTRPLPVLESLGGDGYISAALMVQSHTQGVPAWVITGITILITMIMLGIAERAASYFPYTLSYKRSMVVFIEDDRQPYYSIAYFVPLLVPVLLAAVVWRKVRTIAVGLLIGSCLLLFLFLLALTFTAR
ncbi:MAG: hypothetical protein M3Z04_02220 [Chloroflexota bacterium]|nr:hypothetical protein [Chloroflexota bacterium]